jgi:hypothetical protein
MQAQNVACKVGNPLSVVVGTAGNDALRVSSATASAFSFPPLGHITILNRDGLEDCANVQNERPTLEYAVGYRIEGGLGLVAGLDALQGILLEGAVCVMVLSL